jgi:phosphomannomutase
MLINPKIFKAYDIRALASEITPEIAERIGRAVVEYTGAGTVIVGRDMRDSSPKLAQAAIAGVIKAGADAIDIGLTSTPMFYYAVGAQFVDDSKTGAGIMVTASHNPKEYNGLKLEKGNVTSICAGNGMEEIRELALSGEFTDKPEGHVLETDVREEYVAHHLEVLPKREVGAPRIVVDAGNGMAGHAAPAIMKAYGLEKRAKKLFFELDGDFPNHVPNPIKPENLVDVISAVRKSGADLGVAYDGDADRVGFVDETGAPVRGDIVTALIAVEALLVHPGSAVLYDVRSSRIVPETIKAAGGLPVMCRVGHAFIGKQMRETDACFAGEFSTHYYFREFFSAESSDLAMLYILSAMKRSSRKLSELVAPLMRYHHSGEIDFTVEDKSAIMDKLEAAYGPSAKETIRLDGLRFEFPRWWFNVRASNTEPLLRLNLEASTDEEMREKVEEVKKIINGQ